MTTTTRRINVRPGAYLDPVALDELHRTVTVEDCPEAAEEPDPGESTSSAPLSPPSRT
jgi:hypothetical protein